MQVATLLPVLRLPLTSGGGAQARDVKSPWWQRYYVDLVLLLIGAAAFWRLITNRSPLNTTQTGSVQADPLLLLAPVLLFVAVGSVLLRVFPAVSGALARLVARRRQLTAPLAAWHVSREPAHYGQITFLLALAIGIGWLATSFQVTLARSQHDRAAYAVGSDIRIEERDTTIKTRRIRPLAFYTALPSVEAISPAARYFVPNIGSEGRQSVAGEVLAVDPATFGAVSYWRDDLGELMLPDSAAALPTPGRVLPVRPARISLWARLDQPVLDAMARPVLSSPAQSATSRIPTNCARWWALARACAMPTGCQCMLHCQSSICCRTAAGPISKAPCRKQSPAICGWRAFTGITAGSGIGRAAGRIACTWRRWRSLPRTERTLRSTGWRMMRGGTCARFRRAIDATADIVPS